MMKLSPIIYAQIWFEALQEAPDSDWHVISERILQHIYRHSHVKWLPEIQRQMVVLEHAKNGTTPVTVRTARTIDPDLLQAFVKRFLPDILPVITQEIDPNIIGGVQIETTNQRFNASIQSQLTHLAHTLKSNS